MVQRTVHLANSAPIQNAIDGLYSVFRAYRLPAKIDACPHCVTEADQAVIRGRDLRSLTSAELSKYAFKAMTTWGGPHEFKHFLPRILELLASDPDFWVSAETIFGKIALGEWETWRDEEREAVQSYALAVWRERMHAACEWNRLAMEDWLDALGRIFKDLRPYLREWLDCSAPAATIQLACFLSENVDQIRRKGELPREFWENRIEPMRQVVDWLRSPAVAQKFEAALRDPAMPEKERIRTALEHHGWIAS